MDILLNVDETGKILSINRFTLYFVRNLSYDGEALEQDFVIKFLLF